jgi:micrococcal nuclease
MKKLILLLATVLLFISTLPTESSAHRGAYDKLGGHFRNADCAYLLHKPTALAKSAKSKTALLSLIKKYSSNSCKNKLTTSKIYVEGMTLPGGTATKPVTKPTLKTKYTAYISSCTDGDTANFKINGKVTKTRFLFIDTPESTIQHEKYGKEASAYTCSRLKKAKKITLELDGKDKYDKYNRLLAWVWVDGRLLQEDITKVGLVEDFYDYGTYRYETRVRTAMTYAKSHRLNLWK